MSPNFAAITVCARRAAMNLRGIFWNDNSRGKREDGESDDGTHGDNIRVWRDLTTARRMGP